MMEEIKMNEVTDAELSQITGGFKGNLYASTKNGATQLEYHCNGKIYYVSAVPVEHRDLWIRTIDEGGARITDSLYDRIRTFALSAKGNQVPGGGKRQFCSLLKEFNLSSELLDAWLNAF